MDCPELKNFELDPESQSAVERLQAKEGLADALAAALTTGHLATIFNTRRGLRMAHNISKADWEAYAEALRAVPEIYEAQIERVAFKQKLRSEDDEKWDQARFWTAVYQGCQLDDGP